MTLGEKLRQARQDRGLSQKQVAGDRITRNMLSLLEHDQAAPSLRTLEYLASVLDVPLAWLLKNNETQEEEWALHCAREAFRQGQWDEGLTAVQSCPAPWSEEMMLLRCKCALRKSEALLERGAYGEAACLARGVLQAKGLYLEDWDRHQAARVLALCALRQNKPEETAEKTYLELTDRLNPVPSALLFQAERALDGGNLEEAERVLNLARMDTGPRRFLYLLLRGRLLLEQEKELDALTLLRQAEPLPAETPLRLELFRMLEQGWKRQGDYEKAYHYAVRRLELLEET